MDNRICAIDKVFLESISVFCQRNPWKTSLGRSIVLDSIKLCHEIGFEEFTFKKLGKSIGSPEASIYRYFENKHKLLLYILALYWGAIDKLCMQTMNSEISSFDKVKTIILILCTSSTLEIESNRIEGKLFHDVVIAESAKAFLTKHVDHDNQLGAFFTLKSLAGHIATLLKDINPDYPFPRALATTIIEMSLQQHHFAEHLPSLTEIKKEDTTMLSSWLMGLIDGTLGVKA